MTDSLDTPDDDLDQPEMTLYQDAVIALLRNGNAKLERMACALENQRTFKPTGSYPGHNTAAPENHGFGPFDCEKS